jgi:hypothetical protein
LQRGTPPRNILYILAQSDLTEPRQ